MAIIKPNNNTISAITALPAAITTGKVLQVVTSTVTGDASTTSTTLVDTGLSATITPSSSSSKVLILTSVTVGFSHAEATAAFQFVRGSTLIGTGTENSTSYSFKAFNSAQYTSGSFNGTFLDSPSTTSSTTYKLQWRAQSTRTAYLNSGFYSDGTDAYNSGAISTFTIMEIGA